MAIDKPQKSLTKERAPRLLHGPHGLGGHPDTPEVDRVLALVRRWQSVANTVLQLHGALEEIEYAKKQLPTTHAKAAAAGGDDLERLARAHFECFVIALSENANDDPDRFSRLAGERFKRVNVVEFVSVAEPILDEMKHRDVTFAELDEATHHRVATLLAPVATEDYLKSEFPRLHARACAIFDSDEVQNLLHTKGKAKAAVLAAARAYSKHESNIAKWIASVRGGITPTTKT